MTSKTFTLSKHIPSFLFADKPSAANGCSSVIQALLVSRKAESVRRIRLPTPVQSGSHITRVNFHEPSACRFITRSNLARTVWGASRSEPFCAASKYPHS